MELNESGGLSSYSHLQHQLPNLTLTTAATSPANGIVPNSGATVYPGSVPSAVSSPPETAKRKRGRPRKYGTAEQAAAAKRMSSASISPPKKRVQGPLDGGGGSHSFTKKSQLSAIGEAGRGFALHIISAVAGEDMGQKIRAFVEESKREMCILSASGTISNAFLLQPEMYGGNITYEGRFDILSLSGSYVHNGKGEKTGGLSICLGSADGQIIGGGVAGPLTAAGPIQVIVGTFVVDRKKKNMGADGSPSSAHQSVGGSQFMMQLHSMQMQSICSSATAEWTENGHYHHFRD